MTGHEVNSYTVPFLKPAQDLRRAGVGFALADALGGENALEDLHGDLLSVEVVKVGQGGHGLEVQRLSGDLQHSLTDPGSGTPYRRIHIHSEGRPQPIN